MVVVFIENHMLFLFLCLGIWRVGGVVVLLNDKFKLVEVVYILENFGVWIVIVILGTLVDVVGDRVAYLGVDVWIQMGGDLMMDDVWSLDDLMVVVFFNFLLDGLFGDFSDVVVVFYILGMMGKFKGVMIMLEGLCSVLLRVVLLDVCIVN